MKGIKGFIFDMDGTLVRNVEYHLRAFDIQAERHNYKFLQPITPKYFGWHNFDIMREVVPADKIEELSLQFLSDEKEAIYREIYAGNVHPVDGLLPLLADAKRSGIRCAIGSAGIRENVEFILRECHIEDYIATFVSADDVTRCKPDPEIFLKAADKLGLKPEECVVFEDAVSGVRAARTAGCGIVGIMTTLSAERLMEEGASFAAVDFSGMSVESILAQLK